MKTEFILSDVEKQKKRDKIAENRAKKNKASTSVAESQDEDEAIERPQARVLPSTRAKVIKLEEASTSSRGPGKFLNSLNMA